MTTKIQEIDISKKKDKKTKLTGSYFMEVYSNFNYLRFLTLFRTTRYKVYRNDTQNTFTLAVAMNDPYYTKEAFEDYLHTWKNDIIAKRDYATWKRCEQEICKYVDEHTIPQDNLVLHKSYTPGKKVETVIPRY